MKIQSTKDYSQFKTIRENREIAVGHVKKLIKSIEWSDMTEFTPIIVNENMEILDGQHRLEAAKRLNIPVNYIVSNKGDIETIRLLNSNSRRWFLKDYVDSFAKGGRSEYKQLKEFVENHEIPVSAAFSLLTYKSAGGNSLGRLKQGLFSDGDFARAEKLMKLVYKIIEESDEGVSSNKHRVIMAVMRMSKSEKFSEDFFLKKLQEVKERGTRGPFIFRNHATTLEFLRDLESVYNFNMKTEIVRFF